MAVQPMRAPSLRKNPTLYIERHVCLPVSRMTSLERVWSVLDREHRTAKELGGVCGLSAAATAGALGQLRRRGGAEFINSGNFAVWRRPESL